MFYREALHNPLPISTPAQSVFLTSLTIRSSISEKYRYIIAKINYEITMSPFFHHATEQYLNQARYRA